MMRQKTNWWPDVKPTTYQKMNKINYVCNDICNPKDEFLSFLLDFWLHRDPKLQYLRVTAGRPLGLFSDGPFMQKFHDVSFIWKNTPDGKK